MLAMEKDFDSKLRVQENSSHEGAVAVQRSKSFAFRAPQENYTIQDFELGKIYGVGSYSKVCPVRYFGGFACLVAVGLPLHFWLFMYFFNGLSNCV